jgi:hypothetical protein
VSYSWAWVGLKQTLERVTKYRYDYGRISLMVWLIAGEMTLNMAISQAMWIHGHNIQPEDPALTVGRVGWAGQIKHPGSQGWYHLAIPTSVIVTDIRLRIDSAIIQFSTGSQGFVRNVHIYDGGTRIANYDNLNLSGADRFDRFPVAGQPQVSFGIGISVLMALGTDPANAWIEIHSGGVDFV